VFIALMSQSRPYGIWVLQHYVQGVPGIPGIPPDGPRLPCENGRAECRRFSDDPMQTLPTALVLLPDHGTSSFVVAGSGSGSSRQHQPKHAARSDQHSYPGVAWVDGGRGGGDRGDGDRSRKPRGHKGAWMPTRRRPRRTNKRAPTVAVIETAAGAETRRPTSTIRPSRAGYPVHSPRGSRWGARSGRTRTCSGT